MRSPAVEAGRDRRTPAIVLGTGLTALGTVRNLAECGIPAFLLERRPDLLRWSRWHRSLPGIQAGPDWGRLSAYLSDLPIGRAVLIPCSDHATLAVAALPASVAARYPSSLPPAAAIATLTDKAVFADFCQRTGIPHPRTWRLDDPGVLLQVRSEAFEDGFLKPRDSQAFHRRFGVKAMRVTGAADAHRQARRFAAEGFGMLLQGYVPGPATNHYFIDGFVDRTGEVRALFVRRRLRMAPPDFGNSSYMISVPPEEAAPAVDAIRRALGALRYRGIFSAEFKRDAKDGTFRLLEINPRPWWFIRFAARCGVNVCRLAWLDALGADVPTVTNYEVGRGCVHAYYDYFACRALRRSGQLSLRSWLRSWLRSTKSTWEWRDPLPAVSTVGGILGAALARRTVRAYRRLIHIRSHGASR